MSTQIKPLDGESVAGDAGQYVLPTGSLTDYDDSYSSPVYINVFVTGSGGAFLQASGSSNGADGRYIASGQTAQYGPVNFANFPVIRFDSTSGAWVSYDVLISEG